LVPASRIFPQRCEPEDSEKSKKTKYIKDVPYSERGFQQDSQASHPQNRYYTRQIVIVGAYVFKPKNSREKKANETNENNATE
jgi:hypothetical protein